MILKQHFPFTFLKVFLIVLSGCETDNHPVHDRKVFGSAVFYNEYIVVRQKELMEDLEIFKLASEHDYKFAYKMLDTIFTHSTQSRRDVQEMSPYKNDSSFREAATDLFNFYCKTLFRIAGK